MPAPELTCKELVEIVTDYLEGALSPADRLRFETHLSGCMGCRTYLVQMKHTIDTLGRLPEETVPPEQKQTLLQLFRDWKSANG